MNDWKLGLHDLLSRVGQRDEQAFTWLYESLRQTSVAMILAEVGGLDEDEAEAVYNRAMLKIWMKASTYQGRPEHTPDITAWAWIRTTILHTALDVSRGLRKREMAEILESEMLAESEQEETQDLSPIDQLSSADVSPADRAIDSPADLTETREGLKEFLRQLDERDRLIFQLLAQGLPQNEVAVRLGVSAPRMSQIVHSLRARAERMIRL
jgi:RNA polymerase sigma factor (sigma-70 family)